MQYVALAEGGTCKDAADREGHIMV